MAQPRIKIFLGGDVMTGRGIDQILPHPSEPRLHEQHLHDARQYVWLAEQASGPIPQPVPWTYIWGQAIAELERRDPDARVVNLETSITRNPNPWRGKEVSYRMHPANAAVLSAARLDVCTLANNHIMDYGRSGLIETLEVLDESGIRHAGAGLSLAAARAPAVVPLHDHGHLLVFSLGSPTSGIPLEWEARDDRPGIDLLRSLSDSTARAIVERIRRTRGPRDIVIASIHWGTNWGWELAPEQIRFARHLVDGGVDIVHGHSSHHPRAVEVYEGRLILHGCGDLIDDYEGISGNERYRDDLRVMYFAEVGASTGTLEDLTLVPLHARRMALEHANPEESAWLQTTLDREGEPFGVRFERDTASDGGGAIRLQGPQPLRQEEEGRMKTVKAVMTSPAEAIDADDSAEGAAQMFRDANVGILPVVENDKIVGVVTDRDLVVRVIAEGRDASETRVRDAMTDQVIVCREDDDIATAAGVMVRNAVRRLLVVDAEGRLAGVLSVDDLAALRGEEGMPDVLISSSEPLPPP